MMFTVEYSKRVLRALKKLDKGQTRLIMGWIEKNIMNSVNPRVLGKPLSGNLQGLWRYRVGSYRLIAKIEDDRAVIIFLDIGHRKSIYKKNPKV